MDAITLSKTLTRRLDRVARDTGANANALVRDAVKGHLDYLEWSGKSLRDAEEEAQQSGWLTSDQVRRTLTSESAGHPHGRARSR